MDRTGPTGFLWYFTAIHAAMVLFALYRMTRSETPTSAELQRYWPMPGRTGELTESWVEEVTQARTESEQAQGQRRSK